MSAGELRERLKFQRRTQTPNDLGGIDAAWADVCTAWARVSPIAPKKGNPEQVMAGRLIGIVLYEVKTRADTLTRSLDSACRAVNLRSGASLNIRSIVNVDEKRKYLILLAEEGVADG